MKIQKIRAFQVDLPLKEEAYNWASGKTVSVFDATVVEVQTDAGITGYGEVCPLGPYYLPAYGPGVRTGLKELGPQILGEDPLQLNKLNDNMDYLLKGHPYVKTGIDMACWDILGKFTKLPVCMLMGGRFGESVQLYRAISQLPPKEMSENVLKYKKEGYTKFQLKLGGNPTHDIERLHLIRKSLDPSDVVVGDANTGWLPHEALRIASAVRDLDVYIEQPCMTYEECLTVRQHTDRPFILDENIDSLHMLMRAHADHAADVVNLKISKLGGLTKTKQARDLCASLGIAMTLEDSWGGDIITAAIAHLAHSTPERFRFSATDFNSYGSRQIANGAPQRVDGKMQASEKPGLGVEPIMMELGDPVLEI